MHAAVSSKFNAIRMVLLGLVTVALVGSFGCASLQGEGQVMPQRDRIRVALERSGSTDVLAWADAKATLPLVELTKELGVDGTPVDLKNYMIEAARASDRFDRFVGVEAVRLLNEYFPQGFAARSDPQFGLGLVSVLWTGLFEPFHRGMAEQVWNRLSEAMKSHPEWCPQSADDPLLLAAFAGFSFHPTEGMKRLDEVMHRMEAEVARGNRPYSTSRAVQNLRSLPKGYGFVYSLYAVDGEVCNGGFVQLYENGYGPCVPLAIEAFRALGHEEAAALVEESLLYARAEHHVQG